MFYRNHNLRRAIGLFGIVIALLSGVQQGHTFCYLTGCNSVSTRSDSTQTEKSDSFVSVCSCSQSCNVVQEKSSVLTQGQGVDNPSGSCPCPPTCWCHQTPGPLGLPTSAPVSVNLLAQGIEQSLATMIQLACCDQGLLPELKASTDTSLETVMLRCAKLCRFLI